MFAVFLYIVCENIRIGQEPYCCTFSGFYSRVYSDCDLKGIDTVSIVGG